MVEWEARRSTAGAAGAEVIKNVRGFLGGEAAEQAFGHGGEGRFPLFPDLSEGEFVVDEQGVAEDEVFGGAADDEPGDFGFVGESDGDGAEFGSDEAGGVDPVFENLVPRILPCDAG